MKRIASEGLFVGASQVVTALARVATIWALAHTLTPSSFGVVSLLQGAAALAFGVACTPLLQAGLRFEPAAARDGRTGDLHALLRPALLRVTAAAAVLVAVAIVVWSAAGGHGIAPLAAVAAAGAIVPDALRSYETNLLNARRRQARFAAWNAIDAVLRPVLVVTAVVAIAPTSTVALVATLAAATASYALPLPALAAAKDPAADDAAWAAETRSRVRRFALPLVPFFALGWLIGVGDRFVIAALSGPADAGIYAAAYGLASQGFLALGLVGLSTFRPLFLAAVDAGDGRRARRVVLAWGGALAAGSAIGIVLLDVLGPLLTRTFLGEAFSGAAPLLPWIGAAYAFQAMQTMLEVLIYARHKTGQLLVVQVTGAAIAAVLYAVLIPRWGMHGAAVATLGSFAASATTAAVLGDLAGVLAARAGSR